MALDLGQKNAKKYRKILFSTKGSESTGYHMRENESWLQSHDTWMMFNIKCNNILI